MFNLFKKQSKTTLPLLAKFLSKNELNQVIDIIGTSIIDEVVISNSAKTLDCDLKNYDQLYIVTSENASIKKYMHEAGSYIHYVSKNGRLVVIICREGKFSLYIVK